MSTHAKIAISLPIRAAEQARHAVRTGRAASVSAFIAEAVDRHVKTERVGDLVAELLADAGGPATAAERRAARRALGLPARPRR